MTASGQTGVQRFQAALQAAGWRHQPQELPATTRRATDAAAAVGCRVDQIAKSLVFRGTRSGEPVLVIASGANRVDEARVGALIGEEIGKADADFVRLTTGFAIGGVPPFGHQRPLLTFIDEDLLRFDEIWAAAGSANAVFRLAPSELVAMTSGVVATVRAD